MVHVDSGRPYYDAALSATENPILPLMAKGVSGAVSGLLEKKRGHILRGAILVTKNYIVRVLEKKSKEEHNLARTRIQINSLQARNKRPDIGLATQESMMHARTSGPNEDFFEAGSGGGWP
ncbi:hypothetical protein KIN20_011152 [Parelaphostrongylus tenuis]|uniref:Uncharacterized protein n=1 Tax=Parelaphostrongylus tenuis TaxID=148309 RepID=A0AAD5MV02_PARTN|nr:hypothetical protein KIN20_011152 [Parelaphostrongylus tenuis]